METLMGIGILVIILVLAVLFMRSRMVSRKKHEELTKQFNENLVALKMHEQKIELLDSQQKQQLIQITEKDTSIVEWREKATTARVESAQLSRQLEDLKSQIKEIKEYSEARQNELNGFLQEVTKLRSANQQLEEKLSEQWKEVEKLQKQNRETFENMAQRILDEKTGKFTELNKIQMDAILKPLAENLDQFKKRIEEVYDKESKERFSLQDRVKELMEQTNRISAEANNLATALKGQTKKQGDWGETILESILEKSGLTKDREYFLQDTIASSEGTNLRPDVRVLLPDNRNIIIDSKVSLVAYLRFTEAETKEEQDLAMQQHILSLKRHIDELSNKGYETLTTSLDFTILFVPIEPAYLIAIQHDPELWSYAYAKRILLISPTNLIAVLKIIADLWKRQQQHQNAQRIADQGKNLYEKFVRFTETLDELGKSMQRSESIFQKAVQQLSRGRGNLVRQADQLRSLGVKSEKSLPGDVAGLPFREEWNEEDGQESKE